MQQELFNRLQNVFRAVFMDEVLQLNLTTSAKDINIWDSLTHLELIASVEEEFKIKFTFNEVMQFNDVNELLNCISKRLANEL